MEIHVGDRVKVIGNELGPDFTGRVGVVTRIWNAGLLTVKIDDHFTSTLFATTELEVADEAVGTTSTIEQTSSEDRAVPVTKPGQPRLF